MPPDIIELRTTLDRRRSHSGTRRAGVGSGALIISRISDVVFARGDILLQGGASFGHRCMGKTARLHGPTPETAADVSRTVVIGPSLRRRLAHGSVSSMVPLSCSEMDSGDPRLQSRSDRAAPGARWRGRSLPCEGVRIPLTITSSTGKSKARPSRAGGEPRARARSRGAGNRRMGLPNPSRMSLRSGGIGRRIPGRGLLPGLAEPCTRPGRART